MTNSILSTICGLVAAVAWGSADFFAAKTSKSITAEVASMYIAFMSALLYTILFVMLPSAGTSWDHSGIAYACGAGLFMGTGLLMFYHGLEIGPVSIVSPIGGAYPLVTTILVIALFKGHLNNMQLAGIVMVVLGIFAASGLMTAKKNERKITSGVIYAFATFLLWGCSFALLGEAVSRLGWQKATLIDGWVELVAIAIVVPIIARSGEIFSRRQFKHALNPYIILVAGVQMAGLIAFNYGLTKAASSAVITAISAAYPALTIFLALRHFDEKTTLVPLGGSAVTILGVVLLSIN